MKQSFQTIAIIGNPARRGVKQAVLGLINYLQEHTCDLLLETRLEELATNTVQAVYGIEDLVEHADLAIIIGGDGSMLRIARLFSGHATAVIGMNLGNLGFLAELSPNDYRMTLGAVLDGKYEVEERCLLEARVLGKDGQCRAQNKALNEIVLHPSQIAHMISFEVYIDGKFMYSQRADGMIIATPTGSTAYALSAGGPIIAPGIDAINIIPMFPHTLSSRPIVVPGNSEITLIPFPERNRKPLRASFDSQESIPVKPNEKLIIRKHNKSFRVLHPEGHSFFHILRNKLGWGSKLF